MIAQVQNRYLKDEYVLLVVSSQFDNNTSKLFRALQKNISGLKPSALETLGSAATLSAVTCPPQSGLSHGGFRGRYCRGQGNSPSQDVFQSFTHRNFPKKLNVAGEEED